MGPSRNRQDECIQLKDLPVLGSVGSPSEALTDEFLPFPSWRCFKQAGGRRLERPRRLGLGWLGTLGWEEKPASVLLLCRMSTGLNHYATKNGKAEALIRINSQDTWETPLEQWTTLRLIEVVLAARHQLRTVPPVSSSKMGCNPAPRQRGDTLLLDCSPRVRRAHAVRTPKESVTAFLAPGASNSSTSRFLAGCTATSARGHLAQHMQQQGVDKTLHQLPKRPRGRCSSFVQTESLAYCWQENPDMCLLKWSALLQAHQALRLSRPADFLDRSGTDRSRCVYLHTYLPTYLPTYVHTCIHAYMHTCIHAYMHTCIHTHTYMHTCMHIYIYIYIYIIDIYIYIYILYYIYIYIYYRYVYI